MTSAKTLTHAQPATAIAGVFDLGQVSKIRDTLGQANLDELLDLMLADLVKRPATIAAAAAERDWPALKSEAHILLGSVRCLGADTIAGCLIRLERAALRQELARDQIRELERDALRLHDAIVDYRRAA